MSCNPYFYFVFRRLVQRGIDKNLYKDACINYKGVTKGTKENYSTVIVDYIVEHIEEFKKGFENITVTRNKKKSYKTEGHDGISTFDFYKHPKEKKYPPSSRLNQYSVGFRENNRYSA